MESLSKDEPGTRCKGKKVIRNTKTWQRRNRNTISAGRKRDFRRKLSPV
jgi:hypothetical protein